MMRFPVQLEASNQTITAKFVQSEQSLNADFGELLPINGKDGASAYEVAVRNGFVGTELEWLESLHGEDGTCDLPAAMQEMLAAADVENSIGMTADNKLVVNSLNVNKLVQTSGDNLTLDCGGAI